MKETTFILTNILQLLFMLQTFSSAKCDLICLGCPDSPNARDCQYVARCLQHQSCYLDSYVTLAGTVIHEMGCRDTAMCSPFGGKRSTNEAVDKRSSGNKLVCSDCCHGDLCNSALCGQPGYPTVSGSRGPLCYNCDQQLGPDSCNVVKECGRNEVCSLMMSRSAAVTNDVIYTSKCESKLVCDTELHIQSSLPGNILIGRKRYSSHVYSSTGQTCMGKCCDSDICNSDCTNAVLVCKNPSYTRVTSNGVCLRVVSSNLTYDDARTSCKQDGGDLAIIKSQAALDDISQAISNPGANPYWVGMHRDAHLSPSFCWVDSTVVTSSNGGQFWLRGQPNNLGGIQDCVYLTKRPDNSLQLADYYCGRLKYFICEMHL